MHLCTVCGARFTNEMRFCPHDGQPLHELVDEREVAIDPLVGVVIDGRYLIESVLGEGGMGVVYLATHTALNKRFAVKVLRGEIARDEEIMRRFVREAQSSTAIGHSNIVDISDFGKLPDGTAYFVMEHLEGEPLTERIRRGAMPLNDVLHITHQIAAGLGAAHGRGIVHRDLKPDNLYLVRRGGDDRFVKILDFGIAKVGGANAKLTRTGMVFGTPHYMSPEQAAGQSVDSRADIYALGVILFEMLTGQVPFDGDTFMGILGKHMFDPPPKPSDIIGELGSIEPIVLKALAKKPEDRYESMDALAADVEQLRSGQTLNVPLSVAATPPTDLGSIASSSSESVFGPRPNRVPMLLAGGFILLLGAGGAVGAWLAIRSDESHVTASSTAMPATDSAMAMGDGRGAPAAPTAAPPAQQPQRSAPTVEARGAPFTLASEPAGALVLVDGAIIGNTPIELERPPEGEQLLVEVRQRGFESQTVNVSQRSAGRLDLVLEPQSARAARARRRASPSVDTASMATPMAEPAPPPSMAPAVPSEVVDPWAN